MTKPPEVPDTAPRTLAVVREPFDDRRAGDTVTDRADLKVILHGPHAGHVTVLGKED